MKVTAMNTLKRSHGIFSLFYIAYVSIYIARLNLSMASPEMLQHGYLTEVQLGFIGSAFSVVYSSGRLLNGVLGDRLKPWLLITAGLLLTCCANLLLGFLPVYVLILMLWCLNAFGQSMLWSSMLRSMTSLYTKAQADRMAPILPSSVAVGNILGILLSSWLVSRFGIRAAFLVPGGLTVLMGLICALVQILMEKTKLMPGRIMVLLVVSGAVISFSRGVINSDTLVAGSIRLTR